MILNAINFPRLGFDLDFKEECNVKVTSVPPTEKSLLPPQTYMHRGALNLNRANIGGQK
jgi:hypothetical protein